MVRVILRDGRVLTYNSAYYVQYQETWVHLSTGKDGSPVAAIRTAEMQRYEFSKPCSVRREKLKKELSRD